MFISEIAERIKKEAGKFEREAERRTAYQNTTSDIWFGGGLTKLEREIATVFLTELVSVGDSVGDFDNESNSFFCKNNVTGEEREFYSLFEWSEWFKEEKGYSDHFTVRRPEWKYEEATLKFEWLGGWKEGGLLLRWRISGLPDSTRKKWSEFLSEVILRVND